jgi:hypothetical protein
LLKALNLVVKIRGSFVFLSIFLKIKYALRHG